jgi:predicted regulator of Ras-like GTPase activity (Roadblock/LC7/MglB family)
MFGAIAKLFKRSPEPAPAPARSVTSRPAAQPVSAPSQSARTLPKVETPPGDRPSPRAGQGAAPRGVTPAAATGGGASISIPYSSIIRCVPQELWGKLAPAGAGAAEFVITREQALEQLPQGAVKVSFSELRRTAPSGLLANNASQDSRLMDLPLADILAQLNADSFARRPNQRSVHVSDEVPDLFGNRGERLAPVRVMDKNEAAASTAATRQNTPPPRQVVPGATQSVQQPPPAAKFPIPSPKPAAPVAASHPATPPPAAPIKPTAPLPAAAAPKSASAAPNPILKPAATPAAPAAKPLPKIAPPKQAAAPAVPKPSGDFFLVAVDAVASGWPEEIRQELACMKMPGARLAIPAVEICEGLKRRLVQFPWGSLRRWIQPQPPAGGASPFDDVVLELPLPVITPLFLDHIRSSPAHNKVADSETITDFFRRTEVASPIIAPPSAPVASRPAPQPIQPATPVSTSAVADGVIELPLEHLCASWPDGVKHDIAQFKLGQSLVCIPCDYVDAGLKTGKVEFTWRQVCAWLKPASPSVLLSINGELRVVFPLNLIAPLFIKRNVGGQAKRKTHIDQEIPDLFSAGGLMPQPPAPEAAPQTPAQPASAPAPASSAPAAASAAAKAAARSLGELFNEPDKRSWTPNDIVHRASQLPGVAGALIALQDGLLVAACMPPEARTETIAAFVPQIFGRMSQYTRELQLGDAKGVSFTVETGTLQVFNAGIIYFAALGKTGAHLPVPELQLIATELSRHTK